MALLCILGAHDTEGDVGIDPLVCAEHTEPASLDRPIMEPDRAEEGGIETVEVGLVRDAERPESAAIFIGEIRSPFAGGESYKERSCE